MKKVLILLAFIFTFFMPYRSYAYTAVNEGNPYELSIEKNRGFEYEVRNSENELLIGNNQKNKTIYKVNNGNYKIIELKNPNNSKQKEKTVNFPFYNKQGVLSEVIITPKDFGWDGYKNIDLGNDYNLIAKSFFIITLFFVCLSFPLNKIMKGSSK